MVSAQGHGRPQYTKEFLEVEEHHGKNHKIAQMSLPISIVQTVAYWSKASILLE